MTQNVDRLERIVRQHLVRAMPDFADLGLRDLLFDYQAWRARFIAPQPRTVHLSDRLESSLVPEHKSGLESITSKIQQGEDLTPHLSRVIQVPKKCGRPDRLLSSWGIHHLHLSTCTEPDGTVERGDEVLFAMFTETDAHLIGIYAHQPNDNWAAENIFRVIVENWPDEGLVLESRYAIGLTQTFNDEDRLQLRNEGVNAMFEIDGRVYSPASIGMTATGEPMTAGMEASRLAWSLDDWRSNYDRNIRRVQGGHPDAFWWPMILIARPGFEEYCGFASGKSAFASVGRLC